MNFLTNSFYCLAICFVFIKLCMGQQNQPCVINQLKMQENFTMTSFGGEWYEISVLNQWTVQNGAGLLDSNIRHRFSMGSNGRLNIETDLQRVWFGCTRIKRTAMPDPRANMTKFTIMENNVPLQQRIAGRNLWIVRTDYTGFAVIYSCDYVRVDGTCDDIVVYTLNRHWNGHTPEEMRQIDEALTSVCVRPSTLSPIVQNGGCAMNMMGGFGMEEIW